PPSVPTPIRFGGYGLPQDTCRDGTLAVPSEVPHSKRIVYGAVPVPYVLPGPSRVRSQEHDQPATIVYTREIQDTRSNRLFSRVRGGGRPRRRTSPVLSAVALASALVLTATACDSGDADASAEPSATAASDDGKLRIPDDIRDRLKEHGI